MSNVPYSQLHDYELTDKAQDVRGWPLQDSSGQQLGVIKELLVDTSQGRVTTLLLDNGKTIPATDVSLGNHVVMFGQRRANVAGAAATGTASAEQVLPVVQEFLRVGKREVGAGGVKVETHVTSTPVQENVSLREEHVSVERRPVNRAVDATDVANMRDRSVEVTARSEEAVVAKTARVVEEIVIRKDATQRTETIRDSVKHTDVTVENIDYDNTAYKQHYDQRFASSGRAYEQYAPAYKFGHHMRHDARFAGKSWSDVEPNARSAWEEKNPGSWEHFKEAVQHAWTKVTGA
ncbi:MAG: hypothetical protein JWP97_1566 [Labilithrix sp.]|nr:hypothetical protein [Labilithrix sp.]